MSRRLAIAVLSVAVVSGPLPDALLFATAPQAQVIDRIVARVEGDIIALSEVRELAAYQRLMDGRSDPQARLTQELIEQWAIDSEAHAAEFSPPPDADVDRALQDIQGRFPNQQAYAQQLSELGLTPGALRRIVARQIYLTRYLDYRFRPAVQVDDESISKYYEQSLAPALAAKQQPVPTLDKVTDQIRELLVVQGINQRAADWLQDTKSRLKIEILPDRPNSEQRAMSQPRKIRKWLYALLVVVLVVVAIPIAVFEVLSTGWADAYVRRMVTEQMNRMTGGRVELRGFHFDPWRLLVTLDDLTIYGREPSGTPPFLHIDRLALQLQLDSFWRHKLSLGDVEVLRPAVHVRVESDGSSNVPAPKPNGVPSKIPLRQRIFDLAARRLRIDDGTLLFNDRVIPLVAQGGHFDLAVDYSNAQGPAYLGDFRWQQVQVALQRFATFPSDVTARFTFQPDSFSVTQLVVTLPHTSVDAQLSLSSFVHPSWNFRYRGRMDLVDLRTLFRNPGVPGGHTDFLGNGHFTDGQLTLDGSYSAQNIAFHFQWFHTGGVTSRGTYHADGHKLDVPDFEAHILGGVVTGKVHLDFPGLRFRTETRTHAMDLAALLAAVDNDDLPVVPLHWNGTVDMQDVTTWNGGFQNLDEQGVSLWSPPGVLPQGTIPVNARLNYHYSMIAGTVAMTPSEIVTPTSSVRFSGVLGGRNSSLEMTFDSQNIATWDDFINHIRGPNTPPNVITGSFHWQGQLTGPLTGPTFAGHVKGGNAAYDRLYWDELEGDMTYGPHGFSFLRASARRGASSAQIELSLTLDDWSFTPESPWHFDVTLVRTETAGLRDLLGVSFPVSGLLSGDFHGTGTRASPQLRGLFDFISPEIWGWKFDRARGEFSLDHDQVSISNAELRLLPPPAPSAARAAAPAGLLTGNFRYNWMDRQTEFNLTGAALPLEGIARIQTPKLPVGGQLNFQLSGQGPMLAPKLTGTLRLVDLRLGSEAVGSFAGNLDSDGNRAVLQVDSAMSTGMLHGRVEVVLGADYPVTGQIGVTQLNLNPLISSVLHLTDLTAPSRVDGSFTIAGALLRPETLVVQADISRAALDYGDVSLENTSPIKFEYRRNEIRVAQAYFRGPQSDFHVAGLARFAGDRALDLQVSGTVNLRLLGAFVPHLDAQGATQVDAAIFGSLSVPRVTGRAHLQDASLRYGDFPAGLSHVAGDFIFDATRLAFDNVVAEIGGGKVRLGGALSYNGPARYDVTVNIDQVRIRYPAGMSWHADGTLRLTGTAQAATLSGRVTVDRLLLSDAFDMASLLSSSQESTASPIGISPFLRNLELDVQASTTPNAVLEWPSGRFQAEANVRLRGTWENPVVLGNIHMLAGYMEFRGNRYQLTRGDINFSNPFRIDPVLNIEATTRILEYQVSVSFTGASSHPTMSYRSEPPLPSSDVISLLAIGQTGEESALRGVNSSQSPEQGATTLLSEAVSSQLGGRIQRLFGISHFSVDPFLAGTTTTTQNSAARVTVEQRFSSDLTVTYVTNVTSTQQQVIQIEYLLRPDISIVALRDENGTFGMDVIFRKHFK